MRWVVYVLGLVTVLAVLVPVPTSASTTFFVSKRGHDGDGRSWDSAWSDFDRVRWDAVKPGDTLVLDGGASGMAYSSPIVPRTNGRQDAPITIRLSDEPGRNGQATLFGGRAVPLPYCGQSLYSAPRSGLEVGVDLSGRSWIVVDGTKWSGIVVHSFSHSGVLLDAASSHVVIRNVEIYDNGWAADADDGWAPDGFGVVLAGSNLTFDRVLIHDNGQDSMQSRGGSAGGRLDSVTVRRSWLYNTRQDPQGRPFNYCSHPDGIQVWSGGRHRDLRVESSVVGPGFMQGLLLGEPPGVDRDGNAYWATFDDVTISNSLFYGNHNSNVSTGVGPDADKLPHGWRVDQTTSYRTADPGAVPGGHANPDDCTADERWSNLELRGFQDHVVSSSILYGGCLLLMPEAAYIGSGGRPNCIYAVLAQGATLDGQWVDPGFADAAGGDYAVPAQSHCAGRGTTITSPALLFR